MCVLCARMHTWKYYTLYLICRVEFITTKNDRNTVCNFFVSFSLLFLLVIFSAIISPRIFQHIHGIKVEVKYSNEINAAVYFQIGHKIHKHTGLHSRNTRTNAYNIIHSQWSTESNLWLSLSPVDIWCRYYYQFSLIEILFTCNVCSRLERFEQFLPEICVWPARV